MPTPSATEAFDAATRDCIGLLTLLHRHLADATAVRMTAGVEWSGACTAMYLREGLTDQLLMARGGISEAKTRAEIAADLAQARPAKL